MGINGTSFDAKFSAYEKYLKSDAKNLGLSGEKLGEQFGRYSVGLQYDEQKAANKALGKAYAKELAIERQPIKAKRNEYIKFWKDALAHKDELDAKKTAIKERLKYKGQKSGVVIADEIAQAKIDAAANKSKVTELEKQLKYERGKLERFKKLAQNKGEVSGVVKADKIAEAKRLAQGGKLSKFFKGKKGKAGLISAAVLIGAGLYGLFKSDKKDNAVPVKNEIINDNSKKSISPDNQIINNNDVDIDATKKQDTGVPLSEVINESEDDITEPKKDEDLYTVVKGDCVWNIAKEHLKDLHKTDKDYTPTNLEILNHTLELMEINGLKYESDGYHVMIRPEDKLKLSA